MRPLNLFLMATLVILALLLELLGQRETFAQTGAFFDEDERPEIQIDDDIDFGLTVPRTGDFAEMQNRGQVRVLVTYSKTNFFIANGQGRGFEHDLAQQFERFINAGKKRELQTSVIYIPVAFDQLLPALEEGYGDIAAAGLTITDARAEKVAFTVPYIKDVDEILVTHTSLPDVTRWDELAGAEIHVPGASSFVKHLTNINKDLTARGHEPIRVIEADSTLRSEDLMEMVNAKLIAYTVADNHKARLWAKVLPNLKLQGEVQAHQNAQIAWAVRKDNPDLLAKLNQFFKEDLTGKRSKAASFFGTYYKAMKWVKNSDPITFSNSVHSLIPIFRKHAETYRFRWMLMMAQGYQESSLNPDATSPVGAVGVMQVLPETGKDMGFKDVRPPDPNIQAGIKYMRWIVDNYFNDPTLPPSERVYFALAAYNAGPNRISRLRKKAPEMGLDPNRWFGNVELIVLMRVGREPVRYVANINKYYLQYAAMRQLLIAHGKVPLNISEIQRLLNEKGYDAGNVDGVIGQRTRQAIRKYQRDYELPETGDPSRDLIRHLRDQ